MPMVSEAVDNHKDLDRAPHFRSGPQRRGKGHRITMPKTSRYGTPARDNEAATLWADLGTGARNYRRIGRIRRIAFDVRQYQRRFIVEKINAAPLVGGEIIAGYPWRIAWIIVQTMLFIDGRHDEMEGPQEWILEKLRSGLR